MRPHASKTPGKGPNRCGTSDRTQKGKTGGETKHTDLFPLQRVFSCYHIMLAHRCGETRRNGGGEGLQPFIYNDKLHTFMYKKKIPKKATIKIQQLQEQRRDSGNASLTVSSKKACREGFSTWTRRRRPHQCLREKAEKQDVKRRCDVIVHAHSRTHTHTSCTWCTSCRQYTSCVALFQQPLQLGFTTSECSFFLLFSDSLSLFFFPSSRCGRCPSNLHGVQASYL